MLHKTSYMHGFHLRGTDGEIGHVDDFLVDEGWTVRYLVVDTSNWIGGKSVLISPTVVERVDSPGKEIRVTLSRGEIERSPSVETANSELIETCRPCGFCSCSRMRRSLWPRRLHKAGSVCGIEVRAPSGGACEFGP